MEVFMANTLLALTKENLNSLYNQNYANLNLFIPSVFYVHTKDNGTSSVSDIFDYIITKTHGVTGLSGKPLTDTEFQTAMNKGLFADHSDILKNMQSIEGIAFKELPFKKPEGTHILTSDTGMASNANAIKLNFLLKDNLDILAMLDEWRDIWYSEGFAVKNKKLVYVEGINRRKSDDDVGKGQGILCVDYYDTSTGLKGQLWLLGLIPTKVTALDKVGPGLDPQSSVATASVSCIYSIGFLHISDPDATDANNKYINIKLW